MKKISKQLNETEAENQASKMNNNNTMEVNGTGLNSSDELGRTRANWNGTEMEENSLFQNFLEGNGTAENSGLR